MTITSDDDREPLARPLRRSDPTDVARRCAMCGQWKAQSEYHNSRTGQFSYCRGCRRAYDRHHYEVRGRSARLLRKRAHTEAARAWMSSLKRDVPCNDCGEVFPIWVMHWDHLPGFEKIDQVSNMVVRRTRATVLDELKKCELVCANCHVIRTVARARRRSSAKGDA